MTYTRSSCTMVHAHAALLNGGHCTKMKDPLVGWDDCAEWRKLTNVVIEGGGTINGACIDQSAELPPTPFRPPGLSPSRPAAGAAPTPLDSFPPLTPLANRPQPWGNLPLPPPALKIRRKGGAPFFPAPLPPTRRSPTE